jgi:beta-carotene/zeaxanthin 4-ketolase
MRLQFKQLTGLVVAIVIIALWIGSLVLVFSIDISQLMPLSIVPIVLGRTFVQTGLFIVAHDAIHGSVLPENRRINQWFGQLTLALYALLPYQKLSRHHWQHHLHPGQVGDPDFHEGVRDNFCDWYLKFMQEYLDFRQKVILFFGMKAIFFSFYLGFHVPIPNLFLFWVLPIVLSSIQLFYFGTYLPHRSTGKKTALGSQSQNSHNATSSNYPIVWSFLTCYHFGYHWEHHEYPSLPWYHLPSVHQYPQRARLKTIDRQLQPIGLSETKQYIKTS